MSRLLYLAELLRLEPGGKTRPVDNTRPWEHSHTSPDRGCASSMPYTRPRPEIETRTASPATTQRLLQDGDNSVPHSRSDVREFDSARRRPRINGGLVAWKPFRIDHSSPTGNPTRLAE